MLLPSWMAPRRADGAGVIARAAAAAALLGTGSARLGAELGVPAATVRGWLRRLRCRRRPSPGRHGGARCHNRGP